MAASTHPMQQTLASCWITAGWPPRRKFHPTSSQWLTFCYANCRFNLTTSHWATRWSAQHMNPASLAWNQPPSTTYHTLRYSTDSPWLHCARLYTRIRSPWLLRHTCDANTPAPSLSAFKYDVFARGAGLPSNWLCFSWSLGSITTFTQSSSYTIFRRSNLFHTLIPYFSKHAF
jgi:hypothetical protein